MSPSIELDLHKVQGPLIEVEVSINSVLAAQNLGTGKLPAAIKTLALIDSGSFITIITPKLARKAGIVSTNEVPITTIGPGGASVCPAALINLLLFGGRSWDILAAIQPFTFDKRVEVIIGLDILKDLTFVYQGKRGRFKLST